MENPFDRQIAEQKEKDPYYNEESRYMYIWIELTGDTFKTKWTINPEFKETNGYEFIGFSETLPTIPTFKKLEIK